jgi:hypothetical protein
MLHADSLLTLSDCVMCMIARWLYCRFRFFKVDSPQAQCGSRDPNTRHFPSFITDIASFLNMTSHPLSHNCPKEMSDL